MNSRLIRVGIVGIGIAIVSVASYFLSDLNNQINSQRASSDNLREQASALMATIAGVRAGQFAYVARGQNQDFWMSHVASLMPAIEKQSAEYAAALTSPAAQSAFEPASAALENLRTLDHRVRDFVQGGTSLLAADMIFSDGLESTGTATTQVLAALNEELRARNGGAAGLHSRQVAVTGVAAGALLLLIIGLSSLMETPAYVRVPESEVAAAHPIDPVRFETPLPRAKPAVTPRLVTTAQICGELARVSDQDQLPLLLLRASKVLDASGLIVWTPEPSRESLRPAISHGYDEKFITRMGRIHRDANNAVAAAFRSSQIRTVNGDSSASGALIVPLTTSEGCVGVLSAEMKGGSEKDESSQALATILAAQLATLVATPEKSKASATLGIPAEVTPLKAAAQG
jgi:GAF domain-containing protein